MFNFLKKTNLDVTLPLSYCRNYLGIDSLQLIVDNYLNNLIMIYLIAQRENKVLSR